MKHGRLVLIILFVVALLSLSFAMAEDTTMTLSTNSLMLGINRTGKITVKFNHSLKTAPRYAWESSDATIATVQGGTVTAKSNGEADITCTVTLADGTTLSDTCHVVIYTPVTSITLPASVKVDVGKTNELSPIVLPETATEKAIIWTSSNENIVTVDDQGVLTGVAPGTAFITATSAEETKQPKFKRCNVTVLQPVQKITLDVDHLDLTKGKQGKLTASVFPENASNKVVKWTSSDPAIALVSGGAVTAKAGGEATITATITNADGAEVTASCKVKVYAPVTALSCTTKQIVANVGKTQPAPTITIQPKDATVTALKWSSADETIATVDENGTITGVALGKTTITATSTDESLPAPKSITLNVIVNQGADSLQISGESVIYKGTTEKLNITLLPQDTTNPKLKWETSNPKVATVTNGIVRAVGCGDCTITATTTDGTDISAAHDVTVKQLVTAVQPTKTTRILVTKGKTVKLSAKVFPKDATNATLSWTSDNPSIATVDESGIVSGKSVGTTTIYANSTDGSSKSAKFTVSVEPSNPVTILSTRIYYYYRGDTNCLFVYPHNNCNYRTVKTFKFYVEHINYSGKVTSRYSCEWSGGRMTPFGPGVTANPKNWHWYDCWGITSAYKIGLTPYYVTFTDGTSEYIPTDSQFTSYFY